MDVIWIREMMARKGVKQRHVAEAIGMPEAYFSKVMTGLRELKAHEADAIRRYFGYTLPEDADEGTVEYAIQQILPRLDDAAKQSLALYLEALGQAAKD